MSLTDFQSEFANQLLAPQLAVMSPEMRAALSIYRNTVMRGWIDALAANYPTVVKLVGEEWFAAAASEYSRSHPPDSPELATYGTSFPAFLAQFPPALDVPYLSDVACIDQLWVESYFAADADVLPASILQGFSGDQLMNTRLQLHPATRIASFKHSAVTVWLHNHDDRPTELMIDSNDEDALITRSSAGVKVINLCAIEFRFLVEIQKGATLGEAAMTALAINPEFPLAATLAKLIGINCFAG